MKILILILHYHFLKALSFTDPELVKINGGSDNKYYISCDVNTRNCICTFQKDLATIFYQLSMQNENYELQVKNDTGLCLHSYTSTLEVRLNPCDTSYSSKWKNGLDIDTVPMVNLKNQRIWCDGSGARVLMTKLGICYVGKCKNWKLLRHGSRNRKDLSTVKDMVLINGGANKESWVSCSSSSRYCIETRDISKATAFNRITTNSSGNTEFQLKMTDMFGLCLTAQFESYVNLWPCLHETGKDKWDSKVDVEIKWDGEGRELLLDSVSCRFKDEKCKWRMVVV
jgi:hypothetical protein